ncbi:hypothetical protein ABZ726_32855, partial [Streptomyces hundungensis]
LRPSTAPVERAQIAPVEVFDVATLPGPSAADGPDGSSADGPQLSRDKAHTLIAPQAEGATADDHLRDWATDTERQDHPDGQHGRLRPHGEPSPDGAPASDHTAEEDAPGPREGDDLSDEQPVPVPDEHESPEEREAVDEWLTDLLPIAREASQQAGRISRDVVGQAVRAHQPIGNDRLGELLAVLRKEEKEILRSAPAGSSAVLW